MWRWSHRKKFQALHKSVFSTYVEVIPSTSKIKYHSWCILHVCGGDPNTAPVLYADGEYSPRMWRWSYFVWLALVNSLVFSTYVEVIPAKAELVKPFLSILHVCGGDPVFVVGYLIGYLYSPRMWRWSSFDTIILQRIRVFSTYVEVIPIYDAKVAVLKSILHVCGGDPMKKERLITSEVYSPRMWRWSLNQLHRTSNHPVFSTYVEVIPKMKNLMLVTLCILHVCGGDPLSHQSSYH